MQRPNANEYATFYETYVSNVGDVDIIKELKDQGQHFVEFLNQVPANKESYSYAEGKWTIKQVIQHIIDAERVFAIRVLRIAREDQTHNPGFDQNDYANVATASNRSLDELIEEFKSVRSSTLHLLKSLSPQDGAKMGIASGSTISVQAIAFILAGHQMHHHQVLNDRYLNHDNPN